MAIPIYNPTSWIDDSVPAINAKNLNKIEQGIKVVTDEVIDLKSTPTKATEVTFGVVKMWVVGTGDDADGHISTL